MQLCLKDLKRNKSEVPSFKVSLGFKHLTTMLKIPCFSKVLATVFIFSIFVCITFKYFFSLETSGFVDKLFESLYTKNYLPPLEPVKPEPKPLVQEKEEIKEEVIQFFAFVTRILNCKLKLFLFL